MSNREQRKARRAMPTINHPSETQAFVTEAEEVEFWSTHQLGDGMAEDVDPFPGEELLPARPRTQTGGVMPTIAADPS